MSFLKRVPKDVEYLAVRSPSGFPICKGAIIFDEHPGAGALIQLCTVEELRGLGIATHLIRAGEEVIKKRGLSKGIIGVEDSNPKARALYERLGYVEFGYQDAEWESENEKGEIGIHRTRIKLLGKQLKQDGVV